MVRHQTFARLMTAGCMVAVLGLFGPTAWGQAPSLGARSYNGPAYRRPATSPYMNLLQGNSADLTFEYYRRVRPEQEFRQSDYRLRQSVQDVQRELLHDRERQRSENSMLPPSGHTTSFMNPGGYFGGLRR